MVVTLTDASGRHKTLTYPVRAGGALGPIGVTCAASAAPDGTPCTVTCDTGVVSAAAVSVADPCYAAGERLRIRRHTISARTVVSRGATQFTRLRLTRLPTHSTVLVSCNFDWWAFGRAGPSTSCPFIFKALVPASGTVDVAKALHGARLPARYRLAMAIIRGNATGAFVSYTMRSRRGPRVLRACVNPVDLGPTLCGSG
jgi:hypothetical protein